MTAPATASATADSTNLPFLYRHYPREELLGAFRSMHLSRLFEEAA